jgi:WD40 repeat protein
LKCNLISIILKNFCLHDLIEHSRGLKTKALLESLLQLKHSKITFSKCIKITDFHLQFNCILQLTDGRILTGHNNHPICVWDKDTLLLVTTACDYSDTVNYLLQVNETKIVTADLKGQIKIWKIDNDEFELIAEIERNSLYEYNVYTMIKMDENTIAYSTDDETEAMIYIIDINTTKRVLCVRACMYGWVTALLKRDRYLIACLGNGKLMLRDINDEYNYVSKFEEDEDYGIDYLKSIVQINKKLFATGYSDGKIKIFEVLLGDMKLIRIWILIVLLLIP